MLFQNNAHGTGGGVVVVVGGGGGGGGGPGREGLGVRH